MTSLYEQGRWRADQCHVYHDADQSVGHLTWTALSFNTDVFDNNSMHDTATLNSRITIRRRGVYVIGFGLTWQSSATGLRAARLVQNGDTVRFTAGLDAVSYSGARTPVWSPGILLSLGAGDYLEVEALQDSGGGSLNVENQPGSPRFWAAGPFPPQVSA